MCVCVYIRTHTHTQTYIHTHTMEYYSAIKKKEILPFATTWMDLEGIMLSEINQTEKDIPYDLTYMWNLNKNSNNKTRLIDTGW